MLVIHQKRFLIKPDKAYPFSIGASEGAAVGHTGSCHKHIACNITDFIFKFLRVAEGRNDERTPQSLQ